MASQLLTEPRLKPKCVCVCLRKDCCLNVCNGNEFWAKSVRANSLLCVCRVARKLAKVAGQDSNRTLILKVSSEIQTPQTERKYLNNSPYRSFIIADQVPIQAPSSKSSEQTLGIMSGCGQDQSWRPQTWRFSEIRKNRLYGDETLILKKKKDYHDHHEQQDFQDNSKESTMHHQNDQNNNNNNETDAHSHNNNNSLHTTNVNFKNDHGQERFLINSSSKKKSSKFLRRATICKNIVQQEERNQNSKLQFRSLTRHINSNNNPTTWFWWRRNSQSSKISSMSNLITLTICLPALLLGCCQLVSLFSPQLASASPSNLDLQAASSCQYHQAMLLEAAARGDASAIAQQKQLYAHQQTPGHSRLGSQEPNVDHLLVCPLSSQYNALPQFPSQFTSPSLRRQQRLILSHLNASFLHHLPLVGQQQPLEPQATANKQTLDDQLINEIITPLVLDQAYESAKEQLVRRRKLEKELIKQG